MSYGLYTADCDQFQHEIHHIKQNQALICKTLSSIGEAPGSLQLCSLLFDSCLLHSMQACCSICCPGQGHDAQNCCLRSLTLPDVCRLALTMCMTTAWLSKNGSGMLTSSQAVAEADGNASHTCVDVHVYVWWILAARCHSSPPAVHHSLHALGRWCFMVLSGKLMPVLHCKWSAHSNAAKLLMFMTAWSVSCARPSTVMCYQVC